MKKRVLIFGLVLAILSVFGCKEKMALFPPIVQGSVLTASSQPTFKWKEAVGGATYYMVSVLDNTHKEVVKAQKVTAAKEVTWKVPVKLEDGDYTLQVVSYRPGEKKKDPDVASKAVTYLFTVNTGSINEIPVVECNEGNLTSCTTPSFRWTAVADAVAYSVTLYTVTDGKKNPISDSLSLSSDVCYLRWPNPLKDGLYRFEVLPANIMGVPGSEAGAIEFEINTKSGTNPPVINTLNGIGIIETESLVSNKRTAVFTWVADALETGEAPLCRYQLMNVEGDTETVTPDSDRWVVSDENTVIFTDLQEGNYFFFTQAQNLLGIWSVASKFNMIVDVTPPDVPNVVADPSVINSGDVNYNVVFLSPDTVAVKICDNDGNIYGGEPVPVEQPLPENKTICTIPYTPDALGTIGGTYIYKFSSVDAAGNESKAIDVAVVYQPLDVKVPSFKRWEGAVGETKPGSGCWNTDRVELVWLWESVPGREAGAQYKTAYFFTSKADGEEAIPSAPDVSSGTGWQLDKGTSASKTAEEDGYYTLYLSQKIDEPDSEWSEPVSCTYIVDRTSKPGKPENVKGAKKVGSVLTVENTKMGYPTWSWDLPAAGADNIAYFEYKVDNEYISEGDLWMRTADLSERKVTVALEEKGEAAPYIFKVRSVNVVGIASETAEFRTSVVDASSLPPAPILTVEEDRVGGEGSVARWSWSYPAGKTVSKVWAALGSEPDTSAEPLSDGTTTYEVAFSDEYKGKDTSLMLFVIASYTDDTSSNSLSASAAVIMDGLAPSAPIISGSKETTELKPEWTITHMNPRDVTAYRYQFTVDDEAVGSEWKTNPGNPLNNLVVYDKTASINTRINLYVQASDEFGNWSESAVFTSKIRQAPPAPQVTVAAYTESKQYLNYADKNTEIAVTKAAGSDGDMSAVRYRFSNGGSNWSLVYQSGETIAFPLKDGDLKNGEDVTLFVQAKFGADWSTSSETVFALIDVIPPAKPQIRLQGGMSSTGDTTPRIEWTPVTDAVKYIALFDGETIEETGSYVNLKELSEGSYTIEVKSVDAVGNESEPGVLNFSVDKSAPDYSIPEIIYPEPVNYAVKGYVRLQWKEDSRASEYAVYRLNATEIASDNIPALLKTKTPVLDFVSVASGTSADGYGKAADGKLYAYFPSGNNEEGYYVIVGKNDEGKIGKTLISYSEANRQNALGVSLSPVRNLRYSIESDGLLLSWLAPAENLSYRILRADLTSPTQTPDRSAYKVLGSDGLWTNVTDENSILNGKAVSRSSYKDTTANVSLNNINDDRSYLYEVYTVAEDTRSNSASYIAEYSSLTGSFYLSDASEKRARIYLPKPEDVFTLSATQGTETGDAKLPGKIKLTVATKSGVTPETALFDVKVERTYRYGGTHQGYPTNDLVSDYMWAGDGPYISGKYHTDINNPNPAACPWEKTILLEYGFDLGSNSSAAVYDTLYDTDDTTGEKLIAVRRKISHDLMQPWYERKESVVNANAARYDIVLDPDGTRSEYEWHYLNWDWVMRKYMYHEGNPLKSKYPNTGTAGSTKNVGDRPGRFDFKDAVRCDYRIVLVSKINPSLSRKQENAVSGYPHLTPREFSSLAMILREIAFYEIEASYWDEIEESGISNQPPKDPKTVKGWGNKNNGGSIQLVSAGLQGFEGVKANLRTNGVGYSYFPGCYIKFNWPNLALLFGGPNLCMDNFQIDIVTPLAGMSGSIKMTAYLYGGIYYHGMASGSFITVTYPGYSNFRMDVGKLPGAQNHKALVSNEYIDVGWGRVQYTNNPDTYWDRYTSINWSFTKNNNLKYPGFK